MNFYEITTLIGFGSIIIAGIITCLLFAMDIDFPKFIIWIIAIPVCVVSLGMNICASPKDSSNNDSEYYESSPSSSGKCQFSGGCSREATSGAFCSYHKAYLDDAYEDVYNTLESMR
ncbi:MAG: hypothetical protein IKV86_02830 [Clostridia bacterium]|nr:hypothetical protein [Clostridia bacterium]